MEDQIVIPFEWRDKRRVGFRKPHIRFAGYPLGFPLWVCEVDRGKVTGRRAYGRNPREAYDALTALSPSGITGV
jgi:hypothetical protein